MTEVKKKVPQITIQPMYPVRNDGVGGKSEAPVAKANQTHTQEITRKSFDQNSEKSKLSNDKSSDEDAPVKAAGFSGAYDGVKVEDDFEKKDEEKDSKQED